MRCRGQRRIALALDDVRGDRFALVGRQLGEQRERGVVGEQPDHRGVVVGQLVSLHAKRTLHLALDRSPPLVVDQPARRDRVEPGQRRRAGGHVALLRDDRRGERLRGEVGRHLRVARAALEVAEQRPDVAVVEQAEVSGLMRREQLLVGGFGARVPAVASCSSSRRHGDL
jgi:hypothetical protein